MRQGGVLLGKVKGLYRQPFHRGGGELFNGLIF
jgi:hypothetical protein